jgi:hypothetical protein
MSSERPQQDAAKTAATKKLYERPVLLRWGTFSDLTRAVGQRGASDGGKKQAPRTAA